MCTMPGIELGILSFGGLCQPGKLLVEANKACFRDMACGVHGFLASFVRSVYPSNGL